MIGILAELERSIITERTRAGMKAAQRRGVKFGRKAVSVNKGSNILKTELYLIIDGK
jgi:DNA invertase Pin-like site-specific DNA recombinase